MLLINEFLTGSRSTLGIAGLECLLIILFSKKITLKKTLIFLFITIAAGGMILFLIQGTGMGRYFLGQIMSVIDQVFGTSFAAKYGIDSTTLQNSSNYREALPYIFTLDWLNPLVGRGSYFGGVEVHGTYVHSVDNYYVAQYIKYAYPGLVTFVLFMLTCLAVLIRELCLYRSGMAKMVLIGAGCYFLNLWWVDSLQTMKFAYLLIAVFFAWQLEQKESRKQKKFARKEDIVSHEG